MSTYRSRRRLSSLGGATDSGSYLSRWSRENTPQDSAQRFSKTVERSFTPVRELNAADNSRIDQIERSHRRSSASPARTLTAVGSVTSPYYSNVNYYAEHEPMRKYDVFQLRTWAYPIWKYVHNRDPTHRSLFYEPYGRTTYYTPMSIAAECRPMTTRRGYSGYAYVADEHSFDITSRPYSLNTYSFWRSRTAASPWYWNYYGQSGLRHFAAYRPRLYQSRLRTYWPTTSSTRYY
jgi:hypothetical protein